MMSPIGHSKQNKISTETHCTQIEDRTSPPTKSAMAQFKPLNSTGRFALTFKKKIEKPSFLIKYGDKKGPIREEVDLRCETLDQHYNSSKPVDFVKGEHGDIIIERSSGLSFFSSIKKMPKSFRVTGRLWRLKCDSPFPDELQITYDQKLHGTILPSSEQNFKEEQLKEMIKCLPWERVPDEEVRVK